MTRDQFIVGYVTAFLGAWAARVYEDGNAHWQDRILRPPVEDAEFQAKESWEKLAERCPKLCDL